jgi:hypothetical protein
MKLIGLFEIVLGVLLLSASCCFAGEIEPVRIFV